MAGSLLGLYLVGAIAFLVAPALVALGLFAMGMAPSLQYRVVSLAGPGAGHDGGRIVFEGTPADLVAARSTLTGEHLALYAGT